MAIKIKLIKEVGANNYVALPGYYDTEDDERETRSTNSMVVGESELEEEPMEKHLKKHPYMEPDGLQSEQTEPFQQAVKKRHRKMKIRLIGKGKNTYDVGGQMTKPSYKRSKSAPAGFGGSLEEAK